MSFLENVRGRLRLFEHDIGKCRDVRVRRGRIAFLRPFGDDVINSHRPSADAFHLAACYQPKEWSRNIGPRAGTESVPGISEDFCCVTLICSHDFTPNHLAHQPGHA